MAGWIVGISFSTIVLLIGIYGALTAGADRPETSGPGGLFCSVVVRLPVPSLIINSDKLHALQK